MIGLARGSRTVASFNGMDLLSNETFVTDELVELYDSVGWTVYTKDPDALGSAIANSTYVVSARSAGRLIGLARGVSDDVSIFYLQDLLVRPEYQRRGVGRMLLTACIERFAHVRQRVLLTDGEAHQRRLYESLGYQDIADFGASLHAFVRIDQPPT